MDPKSITATVAHMKDLLWLLDNVVSAVVSPLSALRQANGCSTIYPSLWPYHLPGLYTVPSLAEGIPVMDA
jgi:hypothetical protein